MINYTINLKDMFLKFWQKINNYPIIFLGSLILGILFDYLFYKKYAGINTFIFVSILLLLFILFTIFIFKKHFNHWILLSLPVLILSMDLVLYNNGYVRFLVPIIMVVLLLIITQTGLQRIFTTSAFLLDYMANGIADALQSFFYLFVNFFNLPKDLFRHEKDSLINKILIGILISIPIVVILGALLASADMIFNLYVNDLFHGLSIDALYQIAIIVLITMFFYSFAKIYLNGKHVSKAEMIETSVNNFKKKLDPVIVTIILASVNLLFVCFIIIQFRYLFYGFSELVQKGVSYAEYSHRGFGELIFVSLLIFSALLCFYYFTDYKNKRQIVVSKILNTLLIIQTVVIAISAFKRLNLYEIAYGFTYLRIYVQGFIIWLCLIFAILLINILVDRFKNFRDVIVVFSVIFATLTFSFNIDDFIVKQNIARYVAGNQNIDVIYLTSYLSADAIPEIVANFDQLKLVKVKTRDLDPYQNDCYKTPNNYPGADYEERLMNCLNKEIVVEEYLKGYLSKQYNNLKKITTWQEYNLGRQLALKALENYYNGQK